MKSLALFPVFLVMIVLTGCAASVAPPQAAVEASPSETYAVSTASSSPSSHQACATCTGGHACQGCTTAVSVDGVKSTDGEVCTGCTAEGNDHQVAEVCTSCPGDKVAEAYEVQANVATVKGNGMCCQMCGAHAQKRIGKLDGVEWVNVDLSTGDIQVGLSEAGPRPDAEALRQAVREGGFTPGEVILPELAETP